MGILEYIGFLVLAFAVGWAFGAIKKNRQEIEKLKNQLKSHKHRVWVSGTLKLIDNVELD